MADIAYTKATLPIQLGSGELRVAAVPWYWQVRLIRRRWQRGLSTTMRGVLPTLGVVPATLGLVYGVGMTAIVVQKYVPAFVYFGLVAITMLSPFVVHEGDTQLRALNTLLSVYYCCRLSQLHGSWDSYFGAQKLTVRVAHVYCTFHDSRIRRPLASKEFDSGSFLDLLKNTLLVCGSQALLLAYGDPSTIFGVAFSCVVSGCIGYLSLSVMCALLRFLAILTGRK